MNWWVALLVVWVAWWMFFVVTEIHLRRRHRPVPLGVRDWRTAALFLFQVVTLFAAWKDWIPDSIAAVVVLTLPITVTYQTAVTMRARRRGGVS